MAANTRILLKDYVVGRSLTLDDFKIEKTAFPSKESLKDGQVIVRMLYFSIDSYQQDRFSGTIDNYVESYKVGEPITNSSIGIIEASASSKVKVGDYVSILEGKWETQFIASDNEVRKVSVGNGLSPADYVGILSMPSFTAYVGTVGLAKPKAGETILVSSAVSAVGHTVIQLAKARGLRVIGIAGSDEKVEYVKSLGADDAFNYKTCGDYDKAIKKHCPNGIDIYYDNVGGKFLDAVLLNINNYSRIIACGMSSQYGIKSAEDLYGVKNLVYIIMKKGSILGLDVFDHYNTKEEDDFIKEVSTLYKEGKFKYKVNEAVGLENGPQALLDLLAGKSFGKSILKV